jgi:hypothetical protein
VVPWICGYILSLLHTLQDLWKRHSSDDLLFVLLVLINQYITPVKEVNQGVFPAHMNHLACPLPDNILDYHYIAIALKVTSAQFRTLHMISQLLL